MSWNNVPRPMEIFSEIENAARQEILDRGGSLSHHHGVGKLRSDFLPSINSTAFQSVQQKIKEGLDPSNIFGARNGPYAERNT
jgi:alkyldihydroxyacetonephosphate synthase